jgi:hypothetical protein
MNGPQTLSGDPFNYEGPRPSDADRKKLKHLSSQANTLHAEVLAMRENVFAGAMGVLEKAWQCGRRLNAMKKILGHGHWLPYLETHLPEISESTAQRYMKIDRDNPNAARVQDLKFDSIRKHCLSLAPVKKQIDYPGNVKFPRSVTFQNIVNEYRRLKNRHCDGLQIVDFDEVREECGELYAFLQFVCGDANENPWDQ